MTELIRITEAYGEKSVSARELHQFLESKRDFSTWIKDKIEKYGFIENHDFQVFDKFGENSNGGRPSKEYILSIDMAKELSMVERTEKGKLARLYFIAMEKRAKTAVQLPIFNNPIKAVEQKKKNDRLELVSLIRVFMKRGDMAKTARELSYTAPHVQAVMEGRIHNEKIILSMYDKAVTHKKECLFSVDEMINTLKTDLEP